MRFERRLAVNPRADLIPLIDVVFQLVIYFMVSTTAILTPGIAMKFPQAASSEKVALSNHEISIVSENEMYFNKEALGDLSELSALLAKIREERNKEDGPEPVVIKADENINYAYMIKVIDLLRREGFFKINLKTRLEEDRE